jgi:two-component system, OmpR family, response regulator
MRQTARSITDRVRHALLPAAAEFRPLRVLVVDDHPDAADALAAVLELLDCPARACHDGPSALVVAAEFRPQVCLLDLMMPGMDGLELAARLRDQVGPRPLLLVATTALGDIEARTQTAVAGFHFHLVKPVDAGRLIEVLARLGRVLGPPVEPPDGGSGTVLAVER